MNFLKYDSPIMLFLSKVLDLICLNILFFISSIPIITIGASFCGLYRGCIAIQKGESKVIHKMLIAFRSNFKQATLIWLIQLGVVAFLVAGYRITMVGMLHSSTIALVLLILEYFILLIFLVQAVYVLPLTCRFSNSIPATLKNALLLGIRHFPVTVLIIVLNSVPIITFLVPGIFPGIFWLLGVGLYAVIVYLDVLCLEKFVFSKYIDQAITSDN